MQKLLLFVFVLFSSLISIAQCPNVYTTYISAPYCGGTAPNIMLSNSDAGVNYQLYEGGTAVGSPVSGYGGPINFGAAPLYTWLYAGYFDVQATAISSSCTLPMHDSATLIFGYPSTLGGTFTSCVGVITYVNDSIPGGTWSSSNTAIATVDTATGTMGTTGQVYGMSVGSATITYSITSACGTHYTTMAVNVIPPPTPPTITGPSGICLGIPTGFTASPAGGTWMSSSTAIASISASGVIVGISMGTTTISYVTYSVCGMATATLGITVGASSSAASISGPIALTVGDTALLTSSITSPTWGCSPASVDTISASGRLTGISAGMSNIFCSAATTCSFRYLPIVPVGTIIADSFYINPVHNCSGPFINIVTNSPSASLHLRTYYGDGTTDYRVVGGASTGYYPDTFSHAYTTSGTYTIKHVLLYGSTPMDSVSYTYHHTLCHDIALGFFYDVNSNCHYDTASDFMNAMPISVEVDSNGVVVDTVSVTSGLFFPSYGSVGDVYRFRVLSPYLHILCPSSGFIYDTITSSGYSSFNILVPLTSSTGSGFDLIAHATLRTGRHAHYGDIVINNAYATATNAFVTVHFNSRYNSISASPSPISTTSTSATWFLTGVSSASSTTPVHISYHLETPSGYSSWFTVGDTIRTAFSVVPTSGDVDTTSNFITSIDTANASFDPNYTAVLPAGNIFNGTKLHYTVHFENDGNDTAQNIYVLDTLSDNVDPSTLNIEMATAAMNISYLHYGTHTVLKFDFPNIKLLDSSHHNQCTGFVMFNVKARSGLADGTTIPDRSGIYFDDNEVVLTNSVTNTIVIPTISIATASTSVCVGDTVRFTATPHTVANTHYQWYIGSTPVGTDTSYFSSTTLHTGDVIVCKMTAIQDSTLIRFSNYVSMNVFPHLVAGTITGASTVCTGSAITLTDTATGGTWSVSNSHATMSTGVITGVSGGIDTAIYTVSNFCGTATATHTVTVNNTTATYDSIIVSRDTVCAGDTVIFTVISTNGGSTPFFQWQLFGANIDTGTTFTYVPALSDVITCNMSSSVICPVPATTISNSITMMVIPVVTPTVSIINTPVDSITYFGELVTFYATVTYGGSATTYQWYNHGIAIPGATLSTYNTSVVSNDTVYCIITSNIPCASTHTASSNTIVIYADYLDVHDFKSIIGNFSIFPNPNAGTFILKGKVSNKEPVIFEVRDVTAKLIGSGTANPEQGNISQTVNLSNALPSGNYFIRVIARDGVVVLPFVKD